MKQKLKNLFIKVVDSFCPLSGELNINGGIINYNLTDIQQSVIQKVAKDIQLKIGEKNDNIINEYTGQGLFCHDILEMYPSLSKLIDSNLVEIVKNYLGKDAYLDKICLFIIPLSNKYIEGTNQSDIWHHDSVGHRIKVFFPLDIKFEGESIHEYRENSNFVNTLNYLNAVRSDGVRVDKTYNDFKVKSFKLKQGTGLVIDTHGVHRGIYSNFSGIRASIQLEFSSKIKRYLTGYVGPVSYKIPEIAFDQWAELDIINPNLIMYKSPHLITQKGRILKGNEKIKFQELVKSTSN